MTYSDDLLKRLSHINLETELLESLEWDESELARLQKYLSDNKARGVHVEAILSDVQTEFGESTASILRKLFGEMIFKYSLHTKGQEIEN